MTQIVDCRLKKMCNKCESNLDKPCAWLSLGNEYCDEIMDIEKQLRGLNYQCRYLKRTRDIMQEYLKLIIDIAYDYDGCNTVQGLKSIIDEIVRYAIAGKDMDDSVVVYADGDKDYNILNEELEKN